MPRWFKAAAVTLLFILPACTQSDIAPSTEFQITRIAFGSCAADWAEQPIWDAIYEADPDIYISTGDAIYADWDGAKKEIVTPELLRTKWDKLGHRPGFKRLRRSVPMLAVWDNHDYGSHALGADFQLKEISKEIFLDFWGEPTGSPRRLRSGIYDHFDIEAHDRTIRIILLDTRTFKDAGLQDERDASEKRDLQIVGQYLDNPDIKAQLLGNAQWDWLQSIMEVPADITLLVSSTQFIPDEKGMDEWGNFPHERNRLIQLLQTANEKNIILISGNVHFGEMSGLDDLVEITSSGLTSANINPAYAEAKNSYRLVGPLVEPNFGVIEIDWDQSKISLELNDESGTTKVTHEIELKKFTSKE